MDVPNGQQMLGIIADNSGNIYCYGNSLLTNGNTNPPASFLVKYNSQGDLLFKKIWNGTFYLRKAIFVPAHQVIIATGNFEGTVNPDNKPLQSNGSTDGFVTAINSEGNITWASSFGGPSADNSEGISYVASTDRIIATGSCEGHVVCQNQVQASCDQSMFLATFHLNGLIASFNTFDIYPAAPGIQGENKGWFVNTDSQGNSYVLASLEGRHWSDNSSSKPLAGEYVVKVDASGSITWSTYIISSECYYGHSFGDLETDQSSLFIRKRCDAKYGGKGYIITLSTQQGNILNEYSMQEATYTNIHQKDNDLYVTGNEQAYGCPCPSNDFGKEIFKRMSASGTIKYQGVFSKGYPHGILPGVNNTVYIFGRFQHDSVAIGNLHLSTAPGTYPYFLLSITEPVITGELKDKADTFTIFPNPANATLGIHYDKLFDRYELYDSQGKLSGAAQFPPARSRAINTSDLKEGQYTLVLYQSDMIIRKEKVMIIH